MSGSYSSNKSNNFFFPNINTPRSTMPIPTTPLTEGSNTDPQIPVDGNNMDSISYPCSNEGLNCSVNQPLPGLFKSVTAPVLPIYKLQEQRLRKPDNIYLITAVELGKYLLERNISDYILLDIRPFTEHSRAAIKNSIHVCLPSTLLRRKNFTFEKLIESLPINEREHILNGFKNPNLRIFLYDNTSQQTDNSISLACHGIVTKLLNYKKCMDPDNPIKISVLSCGFNQFKEIYPDCIGDFESRLNNEFHPQSNNFNYEEQSHSDGYQSPGMIDNLNLRLNVTDTNTSTSFSSFANSPSPQHFLSDSPISSSSPIFSLLKFQLPAQNTMPTPLFKFTQNEEMMNLESYISAVNINEEQTRHLGRKAKKEEKLSKAEYEKRLNEEAANHLRTFEFPKLSSSSHCSEDEKYKDKLSVQIKYSKLQSKYSQQDIDSNIPKWFQKLMSRTKVQFASQFQKLDILEKRRLNSSISTRSSHSNQSSFNMTTDSVPSTSANPKSKSSSQSNFMHSSKFDHNSNNSETSISTKYSSSAFAFSKPVPFKQTRSLSQPNCLSSTNEKWIRDIDSDLNDIEDQDEKIIISSGVELGNKNRYKDIFPYEHTRVKLKKSSVSSTISSPFCTYNNLINQEINEDKELNIWENYINANYLELPELENAKELLDVSKSDRKILEASSEKVRYIATQAPMLSTVHDFYSCVINDRVPLILSLTNEFENGIEKCFQYWKPNEYNGIKVKVSENVKIPSLKKNIVIRRIKLSYDDDSKVYEVLQLQIRNWLDLSTLSDPIEIVASICFKNILIEKLFEQEIFSHDSLPTILVHCSAGCGRTGTWCTIDSILSNLDNFEIFQNEFKKRNNTPDKVYDPVAWTVNVFRKQRISMVQNINQFLFIYDCLLYYFRFQMRDSDKKKKYNRKKALSTVHNEIKRIGIIDRFVHEKTIEVLAACY